MSAYVVSKETIDLLVAAAVTAERGQRKRMFLRRLADGEPADSRANANHATFLYERNDAPIQYGGQAYASLCIGHDTADYLGRMLWWECVRSVAYRYEDSDIDGLPGYGVTVEEYDSYQWPRVLHTPDPIVALKCIACYEYQSCEHPDWEESDAKLFCDWLRLEMITELPGYDGAPWGIEPDPQPQSTTDDDWPTDTAGLIAWNID